MPAAAPSPDQPCAHCGGVDDWRAEQLAILRELNALNMRLARAVVARAEAAAEPDAEPTAHAPDPSLALTRLGRAVRLTLAMEARLRSEVQEPAEAKAERSQETGADPRDPASNKSAHISIKRWLIADALQEAAEEANDREAGDAPEREDLPGDIIERINGLSDDVLFDVPKGVLLDRLGAEFGLGFEPETVEERRELQLWRGWELPPHEPEPPDEAEREEALELSS
jgi:hypothetical protein